MAKPEGGCLYAHDPLVRNQPEHILLTDISPLNVSTNCFLECATPAGQQTHL